MTNIADVIGWKWNSQPGMRCKEIDGVLQIVEFPGGIIPTQSEQDQWTAEYEAFVAAGGLKEREVDQQFQLTPIQRLIFMIEFDQENRISELERLAGMNKPAITAAQYLDALRARYKALP